MGVKLDLNLHMFILFILFFFDEIQQVAWIRHSDLNLLTVGTGTYTSDARFSATTTLLTPEEDASEMLTDWSLQIHSVRADDEGVYECQVGTTPHINRFIYLTVVG